MDDIVNIVLLVIGAALLVVVFWLHRRYTQRTTLDKFFTKNGTAPGGNRTRVTGLKMSNYRPVYCGRISLSRRKRYVSLTAFFDLSEELPASMKADLMAAVKSVSLQNLPKVTASQSIGEGIRRSSP